jgi:CheY-like chemotaxis protein
MKPSTVNILLADDDTDDCVFFKEATDGLQLPIKLTVTHNGEQLMQWLTNDTTELPHVLFLDLNMPRKNGFECLTEIKQNKKLQALPVVIFSTSLEQEVVNQLYHNGAQYFIRKPSDFLQFKKIIQHTIVLIAGKNSRQPARENFVITV